MTNDLGADLQCGKRLMLFLLIKGVRGLMLVVGLYNSAVPLETSKDKQCRNLGCSRGLTACLPNMALGCSV